MFSVHLIPEARANLNFDPMPCEATTQFLWNESNRFYTPLINRRVFPRSILMNLVRRGEWIPEMGVQLTTLQFERSAPTTNPVWSDITSIPDGQEGGNCLPPTTRINVASTTRTFNLSRVAFRGPDICNIDIMPDFALRSQLQNSVEVMVDYVKIVWEMHYRAELFKYSMTKVVVDSCTAPTTSTTMAATYPASCPTQPLSLAILRQLSIALMRDGAGADALLRGAGGNPLMNVIVSSETRGNIVRQNPLIRDDIRWSNMNSILVRGFGVTESFGDFVFLVDPFPRRFTCSGGVFTEVIPFSLTGASRGQKAIVNPSWKTATDEESTIFDPNEVIFLVPSPPLNPHPQVRFDPVNYTGELMLKNILDEQCNPNGTIVHHRMELMAASMPNEPERGVSIVHLRCDPEGCTTACAT